MEHKQAESDNLVQLARLALVGRRQDVQLFIHRLAKSYRKDNPGLAERLQALLREAPTRESPLRREMTSQIPVDLDSRLQLVRHEDSVQLEVEPIWEKTVRASLAQLVAERRQQDDLARAKLLPTRTVIFTGQPGVGKSLAARWLARELQRPLVILDLAAVMSSYLGRTGSNVRHVLDYAKSSECVLLLDELDAIAKRRDDVQEVGELKRLVTVLLQEIDDWPSSGLLIAATNHPDLLDPAAWRRFEMRIDFPMPDETHVKDAVDTFLGDVQVDAAWHEILAALLKGLSYSDIEREILRARREAVVHARPLSERLTAIVKARLDDLPRHNRGEVAAMLTGLGLSQRHVHDITGVSRDTIRKALSRSDSEQG